MDFHAKVAPGLKNIPTLTIRNVSFRYLMKIVFIFEAEKSRSSAEPQCQSRIDSK